VLHTAKHTPIFLIKEWDSWLGLAKGAKLLLEVWSPVSFGWLILGLERVAGGWVQLPLQHISNDCRMHTVGPFPKDFTSLMF